MLIMMLREPGPAYVLRTVCVVGRPCAGWIDKSTQTASAPNSAQQQADLGPLQMTQARAPLLGMP